MSAFSRRAIAVVRIVLSLGFLGLVWYYVDPARVWRSLLAADLIWVLGGVALGGLGLLVQWIRWQQLLSVARPGSTPREGIESLLGGFALGLASPGRLGEMGRGLFLPGKRLVCSSAAMVERAISWVVALGVGVISLAMLRPKAGLPVAVVAVLVAIAGPPGLRWLRCGATGVPAAVRAKWPVIADVAASCAQVSRQRWMGTAGWSLVFQAVLVGQFAVLARAWCPVTLQLVLAIPMIYALKAALPIGFMDVGVREGAAVVVFGELGMDVAAGLNAAVLVFAVNVLSPAVGGVAIVHRHLNGRIRAGGRSTHIHPPKWGGARVVTEGDDIE